MTPTTEDTRTAAITHDASRMRRPVKAAAASIPLACLAMLLTHELGRACLSLFLDGFERGDMTLGRSLASGAVGIAMLAPTTIDMTRRLRPGRGERREGDG